MLIEGLWTTEWGEGANYMYLSPPIADSSFKKNLLIHNTGHKFQVCLYSRTRPALLQTQ